MKKILSDPRATGPGGSVPSPSDFLDAVIPGMVTNTMNMYNVDDLKHLNDIASFNENGKRLLQYVLGAFNFYFFNFWDFLDNLHPSMMRVDKYAAYSEKKLLLAETITNKLDNAKLEYNKDELTSKILEEKLE